MSVTVTKDQYINGNASLIMENEWLKVVILPELGAKIWQITYKPLNKELLWNHPYLKPHSVPFGSAYEPYLFGGWDELYPNDMPEILNGIEEPDHGELWSVPWHYDINQASEKEVTLHLWVHTRLSASRVEKWITLRADETMLRFRHKLTNVGLEDQPYMWKVHALLASDEHCRIDLGAKTMYMDKYGNPRTGVTEAAYEWPYMMDQEGRAHDMRCALPPQSQTKEFQYATEMKEGWCSLTHTREKIGFGLVFDLKALPSCWIVSLYGVWGNLETVMLEPCTGFPMYVEEGVKQGTHRVLPAGESCEFEIIAVVYEGLDAVRSISREGQIFGYE